MAPTTPPHEVEAEKFAHSIAKLLEQGCGAKAYDRLLLVAPPHFLGLLRSTLTPKVAKHVELSLDKDYTDLDAHELAERLTP
jgi:protein required for attachment to host cells